MNSRTSVHPRGLGSDGESAAAESLTPPKLVKRPRRRVRRGAALYHAGDVFQMLYVVRSGVFKSSTVSEDGLMQVTGFHMTGDVIGLDGLDGERYPSEVVALEDAEAFVLPFLQCERWSEESAHGRHALMRTLAQEITRSQDLMLMLGTMNAEQRVALFLLDLSGRYGRLGYSRSEFVLRMTRRDIGSYLGLQLETVSRCLSHFQLEGMIQVQGRLIALLDFASLWRLSGVSSSRQRPPVDSLLDRDGELSVAGVA